MLPYAVRQVIWMVRITAELVLAMSTGLTWVLQAIRLLLFTGVVWVFFLPHWWWYLTSANVIRRVAYRSSQTTKRRNFLQLLEEEGLDLQELLAQEECISVRPASPPPVGARMMIDTSSGAPPPHRQPPTHPGAVDLQRPSEQPSAPRRRPPPRRARARCRVPHNALGLFGDLDRLLGSTDLNVNPADGSALRSLPRSRGGSSPPTARPPPLRVTGRLSPAARKRAAGGGRAVAANCNTSTLELDDIVFSSDSPLDADRVRRDGASSGFSAATAVVVAPATADSSPAARPQYFEELPPVDPEVLCCTAVQKVLAQLPVVSLEKEVDAVKPEFYPTRAAANPNVSHVHRAPRDPSSTTSREWGSSNHNSSGRRYGGWMANAEEELDEEDRLNLHNRTTVDIILPVPLDSLMKTMESSSRNIRMRRKKFPIVIDVSGGVWIIGSHLWSTMLARVLAARGYVVFCPDYRNFPQTTMEGMTLDVSDAIAWVLNNAERYNGDLEDVTLMGQSAGAHLTMMSLISQAHLCAYEATGRREGLPPPSAVAYNVPRYNPRQSIKRYVGLSGVYHLEVLCPHFHQRGLNRPVLEHMVGGRENLPRFSIHAYFDERRSGETGEVLPDSFFDYMPQHNYFLHGDEDRSAPMAESATLSAVLRAAQQTFADRRRRKYEESRVHALRSRGVVPGSLWSPLQPWAAAASGAGGETEDRAANDDRTQLSFQESRKIRNAVQRPQPVLPIVPMTSAEDFTQLPPVEVEYILIPNARHTDAIVEECIVSGRSCVADFICDYEACMQSSPSSVRQKSGEATGQKSRRRRKAGALPEAPPDGILPLVCPPEDRPLVLRLIRTICPF